VVIYTADPADDWTKQATWRKANPALGDFLDVKVLEAECRSAQGNPVEERAFRQFRLNQPGRSVGLAINMPEWRAGGGDVAWQDLPAHLAGRRCFGGMDLSATSDIAAYALVFPDDDDGLSVIWRHFVPSSSLAELTRRTQGEAPVWIAQGALVVTEGNVTDYAAVKRSLEADRDRFEIVEVGFNRWQAIQLSTELVDDGWPLVAVAQGFASMAAPTSDMLRRVGQGMFRHGGNPVAQWQAANAVTRKDPDGNVKFDKSHSLERVEGLVAAVLGVDRVLRHDPGPVRDFAAVGFR
jgi:phage terminase large subunit-like protein